MQSISESGTEGKGTRTTKHIRVDAAFLDSLEKDFGIDQYSLRKAFYGVPPAPCKQAIAICEWAIKAAKGDVTYAAELLRAWARKRGVGGYSPKLVEAPPETYSASEHERRIREARARERDEDMIEMHFSCLERMGA